MKNQSLDYESPIRGLPEDDADDIKKLAIERRGEAYKLLLEKRDYLKAKDRQKPQPLQDVAEPLHEYENFRHRNTRGGRSMKHTVRVTHCISLLQSIERYAQSEVWELHNNYYIKVDTFEERHLIAQLQKQQLLALKALHKMDEFLEAAKCKRKDLKKQQKEIKETLNKLNKL